MSNRLVSCVFALAALAAICAVAAQETGKSVPQAEKVPSVIPAPRAEPVVPPSPAKSIATQLNDAFVNVFEHVAPSVVVIDVMKKLPAESDGPDSFPEFFRNPGSGNEDGKNSDGGKNRGDSGGQTAQEHLKRVLPSEGSGFIIQAAGFILTNNHVVANAEKITVRLKDGRQFPGKVVGTDEKTDIAVVKIDATDLPVAELADSDQVRVGEIACAIGVPYNLDYSFTTGVVSAKGRNKLDIGTQDSYEDYIQTDASINPGNSGGPLVDLDGKVIGMNTLINGLNRGLGFAIPSNMLRETGDQLIRSGRVVRPYIGVRIVSIGDDTTNRFGGVFNGVKRGVIVQTMMYDSPVYHSDLHPADVITEVDGVPVGTDTELQKQILAKKVGATVQLTVVRNGKKLKVPVTTGELPVAVADNANANGEAAGQESEAAKQETRDLFGMQLQDLTRDLASSLGLNTNSGVVVADVADESPASRAGIERGDVITALDYRPVKDVPAFKDAAKGADVKRGVLCDIERSTGKTFAVIKTEY
jgi:S1-C subfamily serine protease